MSFKGFESNSGQLHKSNLNEEFSLKGECFCEMNECLVFGSGDWFCF